MDPAAEARHAESLGFDLVTVMDHLPGSRPTQETWTQLPSYRFAPPDRWREGRDRIRRAAEAAGRDPDGLDYAYNIGVRVDERAEQRPGMIAGPPGEVVEDLAALIRDGVTFPVIWAAGEQVEQRERLAAEVLPGLRDAASTMSQRPAGSTCQGSYGTGNSRSQPGARWCASRSVPSDG